MDDDDVENSKSKIINRWTINFQLNQDSNVQHFPPIDDFRIV